MSSTYYVPTSQSSDTNHLSMYKESRKDDYWYLDKVISEQYTVGGLDIYIHKYLGPIAKGEDSQDDDYDATQPGRDTTDPLFIEDLFLLENRDRDYDDTIYKMRGVYNVQDIDFELSQFGLFLQNDTIFMTFHYNNMISLFGRKLMSGDVVEVPNLKDYHPLDSTLHKALPKLYSIQDASFASEGFSPTWAPHLWRVKLTPLVGSQEYKDVLDNVYELTADDTDNLGSTTDFTSDNDDGNDSTLADLITAHNNDTEINAAIVTQAEAELPVSGYDVSKFYIAPTDHGLPQDGTGISTDTITLFADSSVITADRALISPESNGWLGGYLTGNNMPPNGLPVTPATQFPPNALSGDYVLRLDYFPNRLFRFDGSHWVKVEDGVRTELTPGETNNRTMHNKFVNNTETITTSDRGTIPSRQGLSELLEPKADN